MTAASTHAREICSSKASDGNAINVTTNAVSASVPIIPASTSLGIRDGDSSYDSRRTSLSDTRNDAVQDTAIDYDRWTERKTVWNKAVTPFKDIVDFDYEGKGTKANPFLVTWIGDKDAENPLNYSARSKWTLTAFVSLATFCVSLASSAYAGAEFSVKHELGGSSTTVTLGVSLYVLGFALGPLCWAPISEVVGRRNSFLVSFALFAACNAAACGSPNLAVLLVFRFLAGAVGSSPLTNAGGSIADVFQAKDRGLAMAFFASFPLAGPAIGPILGGFLGEAVGFRWVMGLIAIYAAVVTVIGFCLHSETYAPLLLRRRALKLSQATGRVFVSKVDVGKEVSLRNEVKIALTRPWLLLICEPIVLLLSLYSAIVYAILYSFFAAFPIVFQQVRGWSPSIGSLAFLGILVGMLSGIILQVVHVNPAYKKVVDAHGGLTAPPEARLPQAMWAAILLVIGLAGFAATTFPSIHWIVPIAFSVPFGAAMVMSFIATQSYLIDSYIIYAASVLAANSVVRSLLGAAFPLFTPFMYHPGGSSACPVTSCGIHVGPAIAAILALLFLPAPFYFYKHGARIRRRCKYAAEANEILEAMLKAPQQSGLCDEEKAATLILDSKMECNAQAHKIGVAPMYMPAIDEQDFNCQSSELSLQRAVTLQQQANRRSVGQATLERTPTYF